jgi:uncharacterized protein involved in response to NO
MATSTEQMRNFNGPAILSHGFRPFFLLGAAWAAAAMVIWVFMLAGTLSLPTVFDPVSWHAHEFLFGYLGAVLAGFLLTAVPNWTGRMPLAGWPLAGLVGLWIMGRAAVAVSALIPVAWTVAADLVFQIALIVFLLQEIMAGKNWRNLPIVGLLIGMTVANGLFHLSAAVGEYPAGSIGFRLGLGIAIMLIVLIGGRIIPSFTRNWLAKQGWATLPVSWSQADGVVLAITAAALVSWIGWPEDQTTAAVCGIAGAANLWRLSRWAGWQTGAEALVWVLHVAYFFVPLGFLVVAASSFGLPERPAAQHVWMVGAIGLMTLAVMTRASLGHSGRPLHAPRPIAGLYVALIVAACARLAAGFLPGQSWPLHLAATGWIIAFGGFAMIYFPILARSRLDLSKSKAAARP